MVSKRFGRLDRKSHDSAYVCRVKVVFHFPPVELDFCLRSRVEKCNHLTRMKIYYPACEIEADQVQDPLIGKSICSVL